MAGLKVDLVARAAALKFDLVDLSLLRLALLGKIKREHANYGPNRSFLGRFRRAGA
jgi:hypothetical protein